MSVITSAGKLNIRPVSVLKNLSLKKEIFGAFYNPG